MSEKKLKLQSLLSLSSLPSISASKKPLLKPLELSDIIVAMVEDQLSVDKTKQLKSYITKNRRNTVSLDLQQELIKSPLNDLPDFAKKQWGYAQLLRYHIERKRPNVNEDIRFYEKKLGEIESEFSNSLERYKYELEQGRSAIEEIQYKVNKLYDTTNKSKKYMSQTGLKIREFNQKLLKNVRKQQNLAKTIAIAMAWNKSNISKILSQKLIKIEQMNIVNVMQQIDDCAKQIKQQGANKQLQNSDKVLKVIEERRNTIIDRVQKNMQYAIVDFIDQQRYQRIYNQYNDLLRSLAWSDQAKFKQYHQLQKPNIQTMIQDNIDHVYWGSLAEVTTINNIELLREETYLEFLAKLVSNYSSYLVNWHKATSFHVRAETEHKDNCMKMMEQVGAKIVKKVFHLLKYSQKFFSLSFGHRVKVIIEINRLVQFLQEWTGKKDLSLFQVLRDKLKTETDNFRKEINGLMKVLFVEEFSQDGLRSKIKKRVEGENTEEKDETGNKLVGDLVVGRFTNIKVQDIEKVKRIVFNKLFGQQHTLSEKSPKKPQYSTQFTTQTPKIAQKSSLLSFLTKSLSKSITQYYERQQMLPFGHLTYILQHLEFIILLIFKVCVHEDTKTKMIESFSQRPFLHIKTVETAIEKNPGDESLVFSLARMREAFMMRRNYLELHHFLSNEIDDKFDNLVVSGFVNINKLYLNPQQNTQALTAYHSKLTKMIEQLLRISRWLILSQHHFYHHQQHARKLQILPTVLIQITFLYFQQFNTQLYNKYVQTLQPVMKNLKWKIDKFNQQVTQGFREYKIGVLQIYRSSTLNIGIKDKQLHTQISGKQLQVFYNALLHLYCKIDKINDNGRQVLRLDAMEISKILTQVGSDPGSWAVWFQKFIQTTVERSIKTILDKIQQLGIVYPISCWKSTLLWIVNNLSTKEKKQYSTHLLKIYVDQLKQLPEI